MVDPGTAGRNVLRWAAQRVFDHCIQGFFDSSEVVGAVWRHQATAANEGDDLAVMQLERHALQAALPTLAMTSHARGAG